MAMPAQHRIEAVQNAADLIATRPAPRHLDENEGDIDYGWTATEEGVSAYGVVFLSLLAIVLILSKMLHDRPRIQSLLPEAGMAVIVGIVSSSIIWFIAPVLLDNVAADLDDDDDVFFQVDDDLYNGDDEVDDEEHHERADGVKGLLSFSSTFFFTVLLPPIIFNSGYHVNRLFFFKHIRPIILYACVGTFLNICTMAILLHVVVKLNLTGGFQPAFSELLAFGSLIASTDPVSILAVFQKKRVDPQLFYLVFGESVLNDGVCLVLFNAFSKMVGHEDKFGSWWYAACKLIEDFCYSFALSTILGLVSGMAAGVVLKAVDMRNTQLLELSLYFLIMYLPFFTAEAVGLSGIVTILFTGISAKRYAKPNLSMDSERESDVLFRVTAHLAETAIFLEMGLSVFGLGLSSFYDFYVQFVLWSLVVCLTGRACAIYPMTFLQNFLIDREVRAMKTTSVTELSHEQAGSYIHSPTESQTDPEDLRVGKKMAHMMWFSGLRGAVAYACAKTFSDARGNQESIVNITMAICLITVFVFGGSTECFLNVLNIDTGVDEEEYMRRNSKPLKRGILKRIDEYIYPIVVRAKVQPGIPDSGQNILASCISESQNDFINRSAMEITLDDHERMLREMGYMKRSASRPSSLYDFGDHTY